KAAATRDEQTAHRARPHVGFPVDDQCIHMFVGEPLIFLIARGDAVFPTIRSIAVGAAPDAAVGTEVDRPETTRRIPRRRFQDRDWPWPQLVQTGAIHAEPKHRMFVFQYYGGLHLGKRRCFAE